MRFKSSKRNGFQIFAVSGVNTISFAVVADAAARNDLLGFSVEREDRTEGERYFMPGFKVFPSVIPVPGASTHVSTFEHPVQSMVWDDFTAKPEHDYVYYFHPVRGVPRNLRRSPAVPIRVMTEPLFSTLEHDVYFNRGAAGSQAYTRRFGNKRLKDLSDEKRTEALAWLSRDLDEAILAFINQAAPGDALRCCFYEFRYRPVADALKAAVDRGVDVKVIVDAKVNAFTDKKGVFHESFPREENIRMLEAAGITDQQYILREARPNAIQHNKFMVLLKGKKRKPKEMWTGSTNISEGGIHGQTNVGHWVRNSTTAAGYLEYWKLLADNPGGAKGDSPTETRRKNEELRAAVEKLHAVPTTVAEIPVGITPVFSPRAGLDVLNLYIRMVDSASVYSAVTLAFGINEAFKNQLVDNTADDQIVFMLLEKKDEPTARNAATFVRINAANNVYKAWGSYLKSPVYQWVKETNAELLGLNHHVSYVHSKFLLMDPLCADPIVVTGSANFSDASTNNNDENMIIIRGDRRVADIYFTEFNRLFNHYYFRSVVEETTARHHNDTDGSLFLKERADDWLVKYKPGTLRQKRVDLFARMEGAVTLKT